MDKTPKRYDANARHRFRMASEPKYAARFRERKSGERRRRRTTPRGWATFVRTEIKTRATRRGVPFDLTSQDILNAVPRDLLCPILGIQMTLGGEATPHSATVDRIWPARGYVRGNIIVISHRANTLKSDATPTELRAVAKWAELMEALE